MDVSRALLADFEYENPCSAQTVKGYQQQVARCIKELTRSSQPSRGEVIDAIRSTLIPYPGGRRQWFKERNCSGLLKASRRGIVGILELYDPTLFDLSQPEHLHPWELSIKDYWNDSTKIRGALMHTLTDQLPLDRRQSSTLEELVGVVRNQVIAYRGAKAGGAAQWLRDHELSGPLFNTCDGYCCGGSPLTFFTRHAPELLDLKASHHVHPWEFGALRYFDQDENVRSAVSHVLGDALGKQEPLNEEELVRVIETVVRPYHNGKAGGALQFFLDNGLGALVTRFGHSPHDILEQCYPKLFDLSREHHVHRWEFNIKNYFTQETLREALDHIIKESADEDCCIPHEAEITRAEKVAFFRNEVLAYRGMTAGRNGKILGGAVQYFQDHGLSAALFNRHGGKPKELVESYDQTLFDLSQPEHLHPWEFSSNGYFNDASRKRDAIHHVLLETFGEDPKDSGDDNALLDWIDTRLLRYRSTRAGTVGGCNAFFQETGLGGLIDKEPSLALLAWYFADESSTSEHLRERIIARAPQIEYFGHGVQIEEELCARDIPGKFFDRACRYNCIDGNVIYNGTRRYPDVLFTDDVRSSAPRIEHIPTIIDIKRSLLGMKHRSHESAKFQVRKESDISKYAPLCDSLVFIVCEPYDAAAHDQRIAACRDEFAQYAAQNTQLRFIFADELAAGLAARAHHDDAAYVMQVAHRQA